jgi:2-keto-4-pentenoate hydratase
MLSEGQAREASDLLFGHWRDGLRLPSLPGGLRPETRAEGYAIQACLEARSAKPLFGWKIAATSGAGQAHIAVDGPLAGRLLAERAFESGATRPLGANHMLVAEPEFAFRMGRDLPPRDTAYGTEEVLAAVEALHPAIELPDSRFDDFTLVGAAQLIADDACAHEFVLGPAAERPWRELDLARHPVVGTVEGPAVGKLQRQGSGANVLEDPRRALTWLVSELSAHGLTLKAGEVVTTGTCLTPLPIAAGDEVRAHFGVLGKVSLRIEG